VTANKHEISLLKSETADPGAELVEVDPSGFALHGTMISGGRRNHELLIGFLLWRSSAHITSLDCGRIRFTNLWLLD
jgi:hypothetical protein